MTVEQDRAGQPRLGDQGGHRRDHQTVDEVDPAVGVAREPVGVHRAGDDLARRRADEPALGGLAVQHRRRGPAGAPRPTSAGRCGTPARAGTGPTTSETTSATSSSPGRSPCLQVGDDVAPDPAGHRAEGAGQRGEQEQDRAEQAPLRLDADGVEDLPGQARRGRELRRRRGSRAAAHRPDRGVVVVVLLDDRLVGGRVEQPAERAVLGGEAVARTLLDDAAGLEHRDLLGALGRRQPVGDEDAGAPGDQPVGGADDPRLGDRVHPGGRLVEDDDADVAHEQPRERDELLLAGRQAGAAGAEDGVEARRAGRRPSRSGRARRPLPRRARAGDVVEEGDVVGEAAGQHLGALGDHADRRPQLLEVEVEHVDAAEEHRAAAAARPRARAATRGSTCPSRCGRRARRCGRRRAARSTSRSANVPVP